MSCEQSHSVCFSFVFMIETGYAQDDGAESPLSHYTTRRRLRNRLLADYQRFIRPVKNESESVQVSLFISLSSLDEIVSIKLSYQASAAFMLSC